ncbi:fatty acid desaturase family protein [Flavihumibacter stibioxidans]|uniref:Fatty acid desaturase n=1 Tax=Flavihumibacter stibioxidans TaxID=1834163 RepID=A0ABR7MDZ5_9BACT|nr:acyl-CoA desaturase [Flavihumibacter stibioxidans]MBC6493196.1 fatty acid desaturase [Flavihumibacter stibioxidans]
MPKVSFNNKQNSFSNALKTNVDNYFRDNNLKKTGNLGLYAKTLVLLPSALLIYVSLLTFEMPVFVQVSLAALLGAVLASIGFNVMHDACHGSYSSKKWVNELLGLTLNGLGGNAFIWKFKHNILHHTYTNVDGMDDDIAKSPLMRQCRTQKWVPAHRFQHYYVLLVYAISSFAWVFIMDFNKYLKQRVIQTPLQKMSWQEHFVFWMSKVLYVVFYIAIPVAIVGWGPWAIGFTVMHLVLGLTLALVFQLAHVVEHTEFEHASGEVTHIENAWAEHQVKTTANFAPDNIFINWYVGGLNYQVEHHLFPRISHVHYPALSKIVQATCKEHGLPYHCYPTMTASMISHFRMMKALGQHP